MEVAGVESFIVTLHNSRESRITIAAFGRVRNVCNLTPAMDARKTLLQLRSGIARRLAADNGTHKTQRPHAGHEVSSPAKENGAGQVAKKHEKELWPALTN
jgi:hypothetical protein